MSFRLNPPTVAACALTSLVTLAFFVGPVPQAVAQTPTLAQEGQIIGQIVIKGIKNTNQDIVSTILSGAGVKEQQAYRAAALQEVRQALLDKGYYSDVNIRTERAPDGRLVLTVEVYENPVITEVRLRTNVVLSGKYAVKPEDVLPKLASQNGLVVNANTVREDARRIQDIYRQAGYEAFLYDVQDIFDPKTGILTFPVTITILQDVQVDGLMKTKKFVVTREMRSKAGEPFNRNILQRDATRIFNTGLFANVDNPKIEAVDEGHVKLTLKVEEQRTGQVQVGFGYSAQQRLTGTLSLSENNFRGRGEGASASWTVGGFSARNQFELGFNEPWVDSHNTSLGVSIYDRFLYRFNRLLSTAVTNGQSSNPYYEERRGGSVTASRPLTDITRVYATLRTEAIRANNLQVNYSTLNYDEINGIQGSLVQDGNTNAINFRLVTNTRDNERDPASGVYVAPSAEFGVSRFHYQKPSNNPDFISTLKTPGVDPVLVNAREQNGPFSKYDFDLRHYQTLDRVKTRVTLTEPKKVLATRFLLGTAVGNIGFSEQYFMGGADNLRGYADDRFWGNHFFLLSNEYRVPIANHGDLVGVLFLDLGDAWGGTAENRGNISGFEQHQNFRINKGYGFGVRIKTPVGPVRLDYGIGETQRTHFSIGQAF